MVSIRLVKEKKTLRSRTESFSKSLRGPSDRGNLIVAILVKRGAKRPAVQPCLAFRPETSPTLPRRHCTPRRQPERRRYGRPEFQQTPSARSHPRKTHRRIHKETTHA